MRTSTTQDLARRYNRLGIFDVKGAGDGRREVAGCLSECGGGQEGGSKNDGTHIVGDEFLPQTMLPRTERA